MTLHTRHPLRHFIIYAAILMLLGACAGSTGPRHDLTPEQQAAQAYARGDYASAAESWQNAEATAALNKLDSLKVKTADAWLRSGREARAKELLSQVNRKSLGQADQALFYIANADLALKQNDPELAAFYLDAANQQLPSALKSRYDTLQNLRASMAGDRVIRSIGEIADLTAGMSSYEPQAILEVLRALESFPSGELRALIAEQRYDPELTEWLELSLQMRNALINGYAPVAAGKRWENYHYGHLITQANFVDLLARYRAGFPVPSQVAILLPESGGLSAAARAIRDGILAAYLEKPDDAVLRFYSSGENSDSSLEAYRQARDDGATQIIGPLRVDSTRVLGAMQTLTVPVLLLNEPAEESPGNSPGNSRQLAMVSSLSLSQTEEAAAIASMALQQQQRNAVTIVPDNAWGRRMESAFSTAFEQGDGRIATSARFNTTENDHSVMLTSLLNIDESIQRKTKLQAMLGVPLSFEPSRRDDFDLIFLAASPAQGRALKPLLRFHDAGEIPVYAMGRVFSGKTAPTSDQDLNGIVFPTTRWQLETETRNADIPNSVRGGAFGSLYALGQDAWRLLPWLPLMNKDPDLWYPGQVGALRLQANGRLYRQPVWARFSAGRPVPWEWNTNH